MRVVGSNHGQLNAYATYRPGNGRGRAWRRIFPALAVLCLVSGGGCRHEERQEQAVGNKATAPAAAQLQATQDLKPQQSLPDKPGEEISLFDGQTLGLWKITDFGGQGDVGVKDGAIHLGMGSYMTGITWGGPVVRMNYEISLEAMRVEGNDFFCGLTFPVADSPCTLILGGWGGGLCGLSSIDHYDASENETTRIISFEKGKWYKVRLQVVPNHIQAWLDDENIVDVDVTDHKLGIRIEVDLCQPLGIATYATTGAIRNIRLKALPEQPQ